MATTTQYVSRCDVVGCQEEVTTDDGLYPHGWASLTIYIRASSDPSSEVGSRREKALLCPRHVPTVNLTAPSLKAV